MSFSRIEDGWWEGVVARLPRPLSEEEAAMDLRYFSGQVRRHVATGGQRGRHRMPGRSFFAERWGWESDRRVRSMLKDEGFWVDPHAKEASVPNQYQARAKPVPNKDRNQPKSQGSAHQARTKPVPEMSTRAVLTDTQIHRGTPLKGGGKGRGADTSRATPDAPPPCPVAPASPEVVSPSPENDLGLEATAEVAVPVAAEVPVDPADWYRDRREVVRCRGCSASRGGLHSPDCRRAPQRPAARDGPAGSDGDGFLNPFTLPLSDL